jgi:hypothetical protein
MFHLSFQVEQLQLDSMIMTENGMLTENGSRKRDISGSAPAETPDMDSENVNEEELDLTVSSALNSKEISLVYGILQLGVDHDYIHYRTKIIGTCYFAS